MHCRLNLILVDVSYLASTALKHHRAVEDDNSTLVHEHDQVLEVEQSEVIDV